jgi:Dolichyl-phosphate-mannose-protein mannosyltransferase
MRTEPDRPVQGRETRDRIWPGAAVALAALVGLALLIDALPRSSATYDEVTYLEVAADWWRTGHQERITRLGSPLTFWKLQQAPVFWLLDRCGRGDWIDDPIAHQAVLLPLVRLGCAWIWLAALLLTAAWSRLLYGPRAMALASAIFALSPNLLAHGALATMELPLLACTTGVFLLFWEFLRTGGRGPFLASAMVGGLAFSCKFTMAIVPPILALAWWVDRRLGGERRLARLTLRVGLGMIGFLAVLAVTNLVVTGFAVLPPSARTGAHPSLDGRFGPALGPWITRIVETPLPQDWVGFAQQMRHQRNGGPSYLFGATRMHGWWYYYFVALAVKVPLTFWLLVAFRAGSVADGGAVLPKPSRLSRPLDAGNPSPLSPSSGRGVGGEGSAPPQAPRDGGSGERAPLTPVPSPRPRGEGGPIDRLDPEPGASAPPRIRRHDAMLPLILAAFLAITALGSSRNYGVRYLLPLAPVAIVWVSALAEGGAWPRRIAWVGLAGQALAVAAIHPHELSYFNALAGGPRGGRHVLADSNLDWGQGARALARLQARRPELRDLTLYYFGDTDPAHYGVVGRRHVIDAGDGHPDLPPALAADTAYLAVSTSLQWGPWGPPGYFRRLDSVPPVAAVEDHTIAIYRTADLLEAAKGPDAIASRR